MRARSWRSWSRRSVLDADQGKPELESARADLRDAQRAETVGGVIEKEGPIHVSNVALLDPQDNKTTRVGVRREGDKRERYSKRTGAAID
jgi:ribosomal protein L24